MLSKLDKPYYTIIDGHVIFSNHPQTIKNVIDDYVEENTLGKSIEYYNFSKQFEKNSSNGQLQLRC